MQQPQRQINIEAEKKRNVGIAIGLAATGVTLGIVLYVGFFFMMFAFPFALGGLASLSTENKNIVSIDGRLLLFTESVGFNNASSRSTSPRKSYMSEFDGKTFSNIVEVQPFSSVSAYDGKLYFFSEGQYVAYDFKDRQVFENAAIGSNPKGVASPEGIWILSDLMGRPALVLLREGLALDVPLPLTEEDEANLSLCTSKLLWSGGQVHLFWKINGSLLHEAYDGQSWRAAGFFEDPGDFDVMDYRGTISLFTRVKGKAIMMSDYENGTWSQPKTLDLPIQASNMSFKVSEYRGKTAVLMRCLCPGNALYLIDDGEVVEKISLGNPFLQSITIWAVLVNAAIYLVPILIIYVISTIINRVKLTYWPLKRGRVRFASIFRRFLAYLIDSIVTMIPLVLMVVLAVLHFKDSFTPDRIFAVFGTAILIVLAMLLIRFLYLSLMEGLWGRTIGKWICGIMVLRDNFARCTLGPAFLRNLLRIVDGMFYYFVALVTIGATLKWQRIGDLAAGTVVVRARRRRKKVSTSTTQTPIASGQARP